jgi:fibronectin type III domain protein
MKKTLLVLGLASAFGLVNQTKADTVITVTNGTGSYSTNYLAFYDANGTHLVLDGVHGVVTLTYPDQTVRSFQYSQTVSGLSVTGSWSGSDEWNYDYTATVQETLVKTTHSGSGRGGGYRTVTVISLARGTITYDYAGAYAPPLVAPVVTWDSTQTSVTLSWTSASGGVPPYSYSIFDQNGVDVGDTTGLAATITGLSLGTAYTFTVVTTDSAGRQIAAPASVYTQGPTLNTVYSYDPVSNTVTATWTADPYAPSPAVSYSVFYYDWYLGAWVDGADTTGTTATVSGWNPNVYIPFYIAAYDANGVETDYDQQLVSVQAPPPPPPPEE